MKLFLPLVLAFSFSLSTSAFAANKFLACAGSEMILTVDLNNGVTNFWNSKGAKLASDVVFNVTQFAVKNHKSPATAYVINFKKYGILKAQISTVSFDGFAELNHEGQFTDDETGGEEIVDFKCQLRNR